MEFAEDFFKKEVREGFEVSEMMKRAWAAELEVLMTVSNICNANGLQWFADGGTLLGAVRHKGFIPWDDDIDICLRREDYNQLIRALPEQLPYGFVVAGMYAKTERLQMAAEVPHLRVIADEKVWNFNEYMRYFHGFPYQRIGIDIFPIDYIPRESELANIQKVIIQSGMNLLYNWNELEIAGTLEEVLNNYEKLCNINIKRDTNIRNTIWKLIDAVCSLYHREEADCMANYIYWIEKDEYKLNKECYKNAIMLSFENIEVSVPIGYEEVLRAEYGDYMIPVQDVADHEYPFYKHMEKELIKQIRAVGFEGTVEEFCREVSSGRLQV